MKFVILVSLLLLLFFVAICYGDESLSETVQNAGGGGTNLPQNPLCVQNLRESSVQLILLWTCLILSMVVMYFLHRFHVAWFPESIGVLFIGVIVGVIAKYAIPPTWIHHEIFTQLDPGIFFSLLLPAIIFDAGYTMDKSGFFGNIGSIILYAVFGTFISSVVVGCGLYILGYYGLSLELTLIECMMFGSLISAVDPVATLAIFCALGVPTTLHYLVFGESIVNDAVAIVLYETFEHFKDATKDDLLVVTLQGAAQFFYVSIGSVLVAVIFGVISALIFKYGVLRHSPKLELSIFFVIAYFSYLVSLPFLSGIMTILISGVLMSHYSVPNLSEQSANAIVSASNSLALISETFTFLYVGFALFAFDNNKWHIPLICFTISLCLLGRFLNIIPLSGVLNLYRTEKIGFKFQFVMWFAGLRGAIAFALSMQLKNHSQNGEYIFTTTLATVFFTILVLGGGTFPLLKVLKVKKPEITPPTILDKQDHWLVKMDKKYFQKFLIRREVVEKINEEESNKIKEYEEKKEEEVRRKNEEGDQELTEIEINEEKKDVSEDNLIEEKL